MKSKFTCLFLLFAAPLLHAQATPSLMSYQGRVTDAAGVLIGNTTPTNRTVTFRLYSASSGGTALYAEVQTVTISGGEFSVLIGNGTGVSGSFGPSSPATTPYKSISDIINSGTYSSLYLGVTVDDGTAAVDPEISPRQQMVSGAFALRSKVAETVASGAVSTGMIGDASVTTSKIAASAIDSSRIADSTIVAADIASSAITATKIDTSTIGVWTPVGSSVWRNRNVGIGESNPGFPLNFGTGIGFGDMISLWGNSGACYGFGMQGALLQIHSDSTSSDVAIGSGSSASFTETMRIKGNGNVGIGNSNPAAKLDVNGVGRFGYDAAKIGAVDVGFYGDSGNIALRAPVGGSTFFQSANGANTWMFITNGGNVGVNTTNPDVKFSVAGGIRAGGGIGTYPYPGGYSFASPGDTDGGMFSPSDGTITWLTNGSEKMRLSSDGSLGIGTTAPTAPLYVGTYSNFSVNTGAGISSNNGNYLQEGNPDVYSADGTKGVNSASVPISIYSQGGLMAQFVVMRSDERIKDVLHESNAAEDLNLVNQLKVTDYLMKDRIAYGSTAYKGLIAQQVREVMPEAVSQAAGYLPDIYARAVGVDFDPSSKQITIRMARSHS